TAANTHSAPDPQDWIALVQNSRGRRRNPRGSTWSLPGGIMPPSGGRVIEPFGELHRLSGQAHAQPEVPASHVVSPVAPHAGEPLLRLPPRARTGPAPGGKLGRLRVRQTRARRCTRCPGRSGSATPQHRERGTPPTCPAAPGPLSGGRSP